MRLRALRIIFITNIFTITVYEKSISKYEYFYISKSIIKSKSIDLAPEHGHFIDLISDTNYCYIKHLYVISSSIKF